MLGKFLSRRFNKIIWTKKKPSRTIPALIGLCELLEARVLLTAPVVLSINRTVPLGPATDANAVIYKVTFDQAVTGVDPTDFALVKTGSVGSILTQLTPAGTSSYNVAISGITGNGSLGLNLVNDGSIKNASNQVLSNTLTGQVYTVDTIAPTVLSINRTTPTNAPTNASSVIYTVTFSEAVTGVDPNDFALATAGTGSTTTQVTPVNGSVYAVTLNGITGNGTLGLNLVDNGSIHDLAGNLLALQNATAKFAPQTSYATGNNPYSVIVGDVNGDGAPDLVVANSSSSTLSVLLGNGDGSFQIQQTFFTDSNTFSVSLGDVNGDGKLDLIAASFNNTVDVLLGNGNGTFQTQQSFPTDSYPVSLTLGDLNGDGKLDIVTVNEGSYSVSILLGNGDGTFQPQQTFATDSIPVAVALGDLNGDGKPDLVVANQGSSTVGVLLGMGNGAFQAQQTFAAGSYPNSVTLGDVNGDGKPDIAVANEGSDGNGTVSVLLGVGDGSFQTQQTFTPGARPVSVNLADVNADGKPDLLVVNSFNATVSVFLGNGNGTFQAQLPFAVGGFPDSVAVSDLNGDGKPDLVVANRLNSSVSVLLGNGISNFMGQVTNIDTAPPTVFILAGSGLPPALTTSTTANFTFAGSDPTVNGITSGIDHFETSIDASTFATSTSPVALTGLALGNHTFAVRAVDAAGNISPAVSYLWTVTTVATHFTITPTGGANPTAGVAYSFTISAADINNNPVTNYTGTIKLSSFPNNGITFTGPGLVGGNTYTFLTSDLGTHTFNVTFSHTGAQSISATDISAISSGTTGITGVAGFTVLNFFVSSITPTATGFVANFNSAFNPNLLALYNSGTTTLPSITLTGASAGKIPGSLIINPANTSVQFEATASYLLSSTIGSGLAEPILPDDTYTLTLVSGANGFSSFVGNFPLDGAANGGSANFSSTFTTSNQANATTILTIPDFARGPDNTHPILVPNGSSGIPVTVYNDPTGSLTDAAFTLHYNPNLLKITGTNIGDASKAGSVFTLVSNNTVTGIASFSFHNNTAQDSTVAGVVLGDIVATVPTATAGGSVYGSKELLAFDNSQTTINGSNLGSQALSKSGLHVDAYLGDVTGNGTVDGTDAVTAKNVASGAATGFAHFKLLDPSIVGDVAGSGSVDASSVTTITRFAANLTVPQIPKPPAGVIVTQVGADPTLSLPQMLLASNGIVNIPVLLDHTAPAGSTGLYEAILGLNYDSSALSITSAGITLGSIPSSAHGWKLQTTIDPTSGQIGITLFSDEPLATDLAGSLVNLQFHVHASVAISNSAVQLVASTTPNGFYYPTQLDDTQSMYVLSPAPTNVPGANGFTSLVTMPTSQSVSVVPNVADSIEAESSTIPRVTETHPATDTSRPVRSFNSAFVSNIEVTALLNTISLPVVSQVVQLWSNLVQAPVIERLFQEFSTWSEATQDVVQWRHGFSIGIEEDSTWESFLAKLPEPEVTPPEPRQAIQAEEDAIAMDRYFAELAD